MLFLTFTQKIQLKIQKEIGDPKEVCNYKFVPTSVIKQWGGFLSSNDNKNKFISFLVEERKELHDKLRVKCFMLTAVKKHSELHLKEQEEKKR